MPLSTYSWPTSITSGVTTGEITDTLAAYDRLSKIIGGWGARGPVVASSSTPQAVQNTADYLCDGTADQTEINSALATGRPVLLLPGTFSVSASIVVPATWNSTFTGSGWATKIQAANGMNDWAIKFDTTGGNVTGARFADFWVDGNASNQSAGGCIYAKGAVECIFTHIRYTAPYGAGLWCHEIAAGNIGHHNRSMYNLYETGTSSAGNGQGILWQASDENWSVFDQFSGMGGGGADPWAIYDWAGINHIVHPTIVGGKGGIRGQDCSGTEVTNPMFDGVGRTALHIQGSGWTVLGGTWSGGGQDTANTYSHIVLDGAGGHSFVGGVHSTDATAGRLRSFIRELGASSNNTVITGKVFTVNGALGTAKVERNAQTGNRYRAIIGYEDELFARKTANESVTASTAFQDDDHLTVAVEANSVYEMTGLIIYDGAATGDLKTTWSAPAGATLDWTPTGLLTSATVASGSLKMSHSALADNESVGTIGTGAGNRTVMRPTGLLVTSTTAGSFTFRWAQLTSDATATTVLANSYIRLKRVV